MKHADMPHLRFEYECGDDGELLGIKARTSEHWLSLGKENREAAAYLLGANGFAATRGTDGKTVWNKRFMEPVPKKNIGEKAAEELESLSRLERKLDEIGANFSMAVPAAAARTEPNAVGMQETADGTEIQMLREPGRALARRLEQAGFEYREPEAKGGLGKWIREKSKDLSSEAASWTLNKGFPAAARGLSDLLRGMVRVSECNYGKKTERALMSFVEKAEKIARKNIAIDAGRENEICFSSDLSVGSGANAAENSVSAICFGAAKIPAETRQMLTDCGYIESRGLDGMRTWVQSPAKAENQMRAVNELRKSFAQTDRNYAAAAQERERAAICAGYARKQQEQKKEQQRGQGLSL